MIDFLLGAMMALAHFGGLWLSLRRFLAGTGRAGFAASRMVRMAATGAGLGVLAARGPEALALGAVGFLLVRAAALRLAAPARPVPVKARRGGP